MKYYQVNTTIDLGAIGVIPLEDETHFNFMVDFHVQIMPQVNPVRKAMNLPTIGANVIVQKDYKMCVLYRGEWDENTLKMARDLVESAE